MSAFVSQNFIIENEEGIPDLEFHINYKGEIFLCEKDQPDGFFSIIKKEDWNDLKIFIDEQFEKSNG